MKLGILTVSLQDRTLEQTLEYLSRVGIQTVELGTGGYPGTAHVNTYELLEDDNKVRQLVDTIKKYGMEISAFSCHGNPVHPIPDVAEKYHKDYENTVLLAEKAGVDTVVTFSGCPGGSPEDRQPNWVTCPWPNEFVEILDYQWNEVLIPYWVKAAAFANEHGIKKIALEMHPGFCVYNPATLLRLREAVGDTIGANFDPSHLFWQGIDIVAAIRALKGAIYHFHAKDTKIEPLNTGVKGVLDTLHYGDEINRSWLFRTVGYGHGAECWRDIISALRMTGYDGAISIEHEDSLMSITEGLEKAITFLKEMIITEKPPKIWWA